VYYYYTETSELGTRAMPNSETKERQTDLLGSEIWPRLCPDTPRKTKAGDDGETPHSWNERTVLRSERKWVQ
jgi:hypothetical protein